MSNTDGDKGFLIGALLSLRLAPKTPSIHQNFIQITILSSIVAVCNDNIPSASARQGNKNLQELSKHANKLSKVQEVTKESEKIMAKSSFAVANAMIMIFFFLSIGLSFVPFPHTFPGITIHSALLLWSCQPCFHS